MATLVDATIMLPSPAETPEDLTPEPRRRDSTSSGSILSCIFVASPPKRDTPALSKPNLSSIMVESPARRPNRPLRQSIKTGSSSSSEAATAKPKKRKEASTTSLPAKRARANVTTCTESTLSARAALRGSARKGHKESPSKKLSEKKTPERNDTIYLQDRPPKSRATKVTVWDVPEDDAPKPSSKELKISKPKMTKSVLGKRVLDALEANVGRLKDVGKRGTLRSREKPGAQEQDAPQTSRKKARTTASNKPEQEQEPDQKQEPKRKPVRPRTKKLYLSQGLYVGQDPNYDPRLNAARNLKKIQSIGEDKMIKQRKILPFPMFAGKRLLETGRDFVLPFDIFNPLPARQPKPEEWRKTHKNVFIGDAADIWKKTKKMEHSTCVCTIESGCDETCFNRFMFYECDSTNCNIGPEHCTNRSFEDLRQRCKAGGKYHIGVEVIKTADRGYGVRSNRTFEPNQIIVEYTGEIITQDECDTRMRTRYKDNECFYLMVFDQNMIIDATRGSITRFVNHSCEPNCRVEKWTVAGKPRMALFAGEKGIMTGEELTYDYNFDPFSSKNIQECRCGTPSCRGVLGPKNKEKEIKEDSAPTGRASAKSTKRKLQRDKEEDDDDVAAGSPKKKNKTKIAPAAATVPKRKYVRKVEKTAKASVLKPRAKLALEKLSKAVVAKTQMKAKLKGVSSSAKTKTIPKSKTKSKSVVKVAASAKTSTTHRGRGRPPKKK